MAISYTETVRRSQERVVFKRFEEALAPLLAETAPDWLLHHMELRRVPFDQDMQERVEIRLVLKGIGEVRERRDSVARTQLLPE